MATQLQLRRGNTSATGAFTGAIAEITVDTDKKTLIIHDGSTSGGFPLARESEMAANAASLISAYAQANAAFDKANTANSYAQAAFDKANTGDPQGASAYDKANSAYDKANTANTYAQSAYNKANSGYTQANTATTSAQAAFDKANTANVYAQAAFDFANTSNIKMDSSYAFANTVNIKLDSAYTFANSINIKVDSAYAWANTVNISSSSAYAKANAANNLAQAAFDKANTDFTNISTTADVYANATYVPVITLTANGRVSSITNTAISFPSEADTLATVTGRGATTTQAINISNSTASTSNATGALTVNGGAGFKGNVYADSVYSGGVLAATLADVLALSIALG